MTSTQLQQYDLFLDENDWDIYYWATQQPTPTSRETAEGAGKDMATPVSSGSPANVVGTEPGKAHDEATAQPGGKGDQRTQNIAGEWKNVAGSFKPAYRPVPQRWRNSEILAMLKKHVIDRSAGGVAYEEEGLTSSSAKVEGEGLQRSVKGTGGGGLGMMPELKNFDKQSDSRS